MKHDQVLRIGSLTGRNIIRDAARHNLRELPPEPHIDSSLSYLNCVLYGAETAAGVVQRAKEMMAAAGVKPRKNAVLGIEVLVCLPARFSGDAMAFFADALAWADEFFQVPVLSAAAHFDEENPHLHVILLPIVGDKLKGDKVKGDLKRIHAMQGDFYASVGKKHGLRKKTAHRLNKTEQRDTAKKILDVIVANPALIQGGQVKHLLLDAIVQSLEAFAASTGVELPEPKIKESFVSIMTKPQRPESKKSPIGVFESPIGVLKSANGPKTGNPYALLGDFGFRVIPLTGDSRFDLVSINDDAFADFAPSAALPSPLPSDKPGIPPASILH